MTGLARHLAPLRLCGKISFNVGDRTPVLQRRIGFARVRNPALQRFTADRAALLKLQGLFLGNKSPDRFDEAILKIQPAVFAVGQNRYAVGFLFGDEFVDRLILNPSQFAIADFAVAMASVGVLER